MKNTIKKIVSLVLATALIIGVVAVAKPETVSAKGNALSASSEMYGVDCQKLSWWQVFSWCKVTISNKNTNKMNTVTYKIYDQNNKLYKSGSVSGKSSSTVTLKSGGFYTVEIWNYNVYTGLNSPVTCKGNSYCTVYHY